MPDTFRDRYERDHTLHRWVRDQITSAQANPHKDDEVSWRIINAIRSDYRHNPDLLQRIPAPPACTMDQSCPHGKSGAEPRKSLVREMLPPLLAFAAVAVFAIGLMVGMKLGWNLKEKSLRESVVQPSQEP